MMFVASCQLLHCRRTECFARWGRQQACPWRGNTRLDEGFGLTIIVVVEVAQIDSYLRDNGVEPTVGLV